MSFTTHPILLGVGLALIVVGFLMWRIAGRWDLKGQAVDSALKSAWHRRVVVSDGLGDTSNVGTGHGHYHYDTGGGGGHDSCSSIPAPKSSVSESSSTFSQSCSALGGNNKDSSATTHASNDTTIGSIEITPGQFAKLLKGRQTWNAMHNGTAVSASCIICTSTLQCCPEADYVLCPDCNVVSPLSSNDDDNHSRGSSSHRDANRQESIRKLSTESDHVGAVGLGYKRS